MAKIALDSLALQARRVSLGLRAKNVAETLKISSNTYSAKERGLNQFSDKEKLMMAQILKMNCYEFCKIFYSGLIPTVWTEGDAHGSKKNIV